MPREELRTLIGKQVMLTLVDTGEFHPFGIDAATADVTVLHPASSEGRKWAAQLTERTPLRLSVAVKDGLLVANVVVERWSGVAKVLTVHNASNTDFVQRRSTFRVPVAFPAQVGYERDGAVTFASGQTVDVSENGLSLSAKGIMLEGGELTAISLQMRAAALLLVARVILPGDGRSLPSRFAISQIMAADQARLAADLRWAELNMVRTVVSPRA